MAIATKQLNLLDNLVKKGKVGPNGVFVPQLKKYQRSNIRPFGDGETIVLQTWDDNAYQELKHDPQLIKEIPYWLDADIVAVDLYFPNSEYNRLWAVINGH